MERVYLGLGSNLGNRKKNLKRALDYLASDAKIKIIKLSSIYETSPIGPKQNDFLNCVLGIQTAYAPLELLRVLKGIEKRMKRVKTVRDGPRTIDLDILFYGTKMMQTKKLTVPHPRFSERRFVLEPLSEIAPSLKPPRFSATILGLKEKLTRPDQRVKLYGKFKYE